jgi:hypothetical protein
MRLPPARGRSGRRSAPYNPHASCTSAVCQSHCYSGALFLDWVLEFRRNDSRTTRARPGGPSRFRSEPSPLSFRLRLNCRRAPLAAPRRRHKPMAPSPGQLEALFATALRTQCSLDSCLVPRVEAHSSQHNSRCSSKLQLARLHCATAHDGVTLESRVLRGGYFTVRRRWARARNTWSIASSKGEPFSKSRWSTAVPNEGSPSRLPRTLGGAASRARMD